MTFQVSHNGVGGSDETLLVQLRRRATFRSARLGQTQEIPARNVTFLRETENATDYATVGNRVINRSVNVERIEKATGRGVLRQRVVDSGPTRNGGAA